MHIGFRHDMPACLDQALDDFGVPGSLRCISERGAAGSRRITGDVDRVLDGHGRSLGIAE